jgi:hypothetical protein
MARNKQHLNVTLRIDAMDLPSVLDVLRGTAALVNVAVAPDDLPNGLSTPRAAPRYANGKRNKGISGDDLLIELMATAPISRKFSTDELGNSFVARGFARHTASPTLSRAFARGLVALVKPGTYTRTELMISPKKQ